MKKIIKTEKIVNYVDKLVNIPSPTGFTKEVEKYLIQNAKTKGIDYQQTRKGAIIYKFEKDNKPGTMFAAHIDTLGAMVKEVKNDCVKLTSIGGYPLMYVVGDYCKIHTFDGKLIEGTILPDNPAVHVNEKIRDIKLNFNNSHVRVDIKLKDDKDKLENYIEVGNFVSFDPKYRYVNGFLKTRHLDDKASAAVMLHIADLMKSGEIKFDKNVYFFFNITEETGQGLAGFPEIDDLVIVDMGVVGDGVKGSEFKVSICAKDSSGPYNYDLTQELIGLAKSNKLDYIVDVFPFYGSDGSAALRAGNDIRVALIGPGVNASHGYERCHENSLKNTGDLIEKIIVN